MASFTSERLPALCTFWEYNGSSIIYKQNGVVKRTVSTTANRTFYFDSSFYSTGYQLKDVRFGSQQGITLTYDGAGNRRSAAQYTNGALTTENYTYDDNNRLTAANVSGSATSARSYDLANRVIEQITYSSPGAVSERRVSTYNNNGWLTTQNIYNSANTQTQQISYTSYDALGDVLNYQIAVLTGTTYTNYYAHAYKKFDSYKDDNIAATSTYFQPGSTTFAYDVNGNLTSVTDTAQSSNNRTMVNDLAGHILQKTQGGNTQYYFYTNGNAVGTTGGLAPTNFDYNYTAVSDQYPSTTPNTYVVSQGDTLQSIALAVYGDAKLWYLIADANGLTGSNLTVGASLTIPNKVANLHNDYQTFKPYAPGQIIGDTTPTLPDPPPQVQASGGGGGCGGVGTIIVVVVAVVATVMTAGAALAAMPSLGVVGSGMVGAAVGSIASQGVAMAMGMQNKFSWGAVGMAAIAGGVTAGIGASGLQNSLANTLGAVGSKIAVAAIGSTVTQGLGVALGLKDKFDWRGVATSAIAAPLAMAAGNAAGAATAGLGSNFVTDFASRMASGIVSQGVHMVVYGGGKMDYAAIAADAFGNAIGDSIVERMEASSSAERDKYSLAGRNSSSIGLKASGGIGLSYGGYRATGSYVPEDVPAVTDLSNMDDRGGGVAQVANASGRSGPPDSYWNMMADSGAIMTSGAPPSFTGNTPSGEPVLRLGGDSTSAAEDAAVAMQKEIEWENQSRVPVMPYPEIVVTPLPPASPSDNAGALPEIELQGRYAGGVTQAASMGWREAMNPDNSWGQRLIFGGLSLPATAAAIVESALYAPFNIRQATNEAGQYFARANMQSDPDLRNIDLLHAISLGAEGFTSAGALFGGVRPPVGVVQRGNAGIVDNVVPTTELAAGALPNRFSGIQEASSYLRAEGVSRGRRVQILQSFEADSVVVRQAGTQEYGIRYYDNIKALDDGRYLFETFPATRESLAVKSATHSSETWNDMTYFKQWQIRPGATIVEGRATSQGAGYPGGQIQKFILNPSKDYIVP